MEPNKIKKKKKVAKLTKKFENKALPLEKLKEKIIEESCDCSQCEKSTELKKNDNFFSRALEFLGF